jgi:hypothetical protein
MMKSPALQDALKPLGKLAADAHASYELDPAMSSAEDQAHEAEANAIRSEMKKAAKTGNDARWGAED